MIKRNNPLNIRYNRANGWNGQVGSENGFVVFDSVHNGIRAAVVLLHTYWTKRNCRTLWDIIHRWAPSHENPTLEYVDYIQDRFTDDYGSSKSFPTDMPLARSWSSALPRICKLIKYMADFESPDNGIRLDTIISVARKLNLK